MSRALVLNVSYEALGVVSSRRALGLVLSGKALSLHDSKDIFHSTQAKFNVPSVVRLNYFVRVPYPTRVALNKRSVFARDNYICQYCGAPAENIDHVIPRSKGGEHCWENVVASCKTCNSKKEDRLLSETNFVLRRLPMAPKGKAWIHLLGAVNEDWVPYVGSSPMSA